VECLVAPMVALLKNANMERKETNEPATPTSHLKKGATNESSASENASMGGGSEEGDNRSVSTAVLSFATDTSADHHPAPASQVAASHEVGELQHQQGSEAVRLAAALVASVSQQPTDELVKNRSESLAFAVTGQRTDFGESSFANDDSIFSYSLLEGKLQAQGIVPSKARSSSFPLRGQQDYPSAGVFALHPTFGQESAQQESSVSTSSSSSKGSGDSPKETSSRPAKAGSTKINKGMALRRGKWTAEEEAYVARVIQDFNSGFLDAPAGTTLRTYLSEKLKCDPMRITKKFTGEACIGKRVFHPAVRNPSNAEAIDKAQVRYRSNDILFRNLEKNYSLSVSFLSFLFHLVCSRN
jgi:hypothetical protein